MKSLLNIFSVILTLLVIECELKSVNVIDKETECFSQSRIYHPQTDKCYKLLTRGPCEPGYWFVLEKPRKSSYGKYPEFKINGICVEEKCPEGDYYWSSTKTCVQAKDKNRLCGGFSDEELLNNVFGEAECMCARDPIRARLDGSERSRCYQLYTQGPCRRREVIAYPEGELEKATCLQDRCYDEKIRRQKEGKLSTDSVLAPWKNGSCYELATQGPCSETLKFKVGGPDLQGILAHLTASSNYLRRLRQDVIRRRIRKLHKPIIHLFNIFFIISALGLSISSVHETTLQPDCVTLTNTIFDLEKPQKCYQDENGDCQKKINSSQTQIAEKYKQELLSSIKAARKRRQLVPGT